MKHLLSVIAIFAVTVVLNAQDIGQAFAAKTFQDGDFALNYRIHVPENIPPGEKVPLVLLLHGAGERGDDNTSQLRHGAPSLLAYTKKHNIPAIILVPQCPPGMQWVDVPWGDDAHTMPATPSVPMRAVRALLAQSLATLPVDPDRVYLTGISMGGFGTWDLLQRDPELFAAAIPVCGGGDLAEAKKLTNIPIRAFHGDKDQAVKTSRSRNMVEAIKQAGGKLVGYTEYPGVGHDCWSVTYANDEVLDWLFQQKKSRQK